jgi:hypothetical protein
LELGVFQFLTTGFAGVFLRGKHPLGDISFGRLPIWVSLIFIAGKLTRAGSKFAAV